MIKLGSPEAEKDNTPKILDMFDRTKLSINRDSAEIFSAGRSTGHSIGTLVGIISNIDKLKNKKEDLPKAITLLGGILGELINGVNIANDEIRIRTETPSERNNRLRLQIKELEAMKETKGLEKQLDELIGNSYTNEALEEEIKDQEAKLKNLKKKKLDKKKTPK